MPVVADEDEDALLKIAPSGPASLRCFDSELDETMEALMAGGADASSPVATPTKTKREQVGGLQRHHHGLAALSLAVCLVLIASLLTRAFREEVPKKLHELSAQEVADTFASLAHRSLVPTSAQLSVLALRAEKVAGDMRARDVSKTLDAYAKLGQHPPDSLLDALGKRARLVVQDMDAKDVTDTMNAYAKLQQFLPPGAARAESELLREELAQEAVAERVAGDHLITELGTASDEAM